MAMNFNEMLHNNTTILVDGAMGTQLAAAGLEMGGHNCISHPDAVLTVHKNYIDAGCDILTTNTLTMNRIYIETHGVDVDVGEVNRAGARLAREAATSRGLVFGNLSSTGQLLEPYGNYSENQFIETFKEQAEYLISADVEGFIIETMLDLREALCALKGCRAVSELPVLVTLSFQTTDKGGRTMMGNSAADVARELADAGATAVVANCGELSPSETAVIVNFMKDAVDIPIMAQPNAGKPRLENGQAVFDMTPGDFADGIAQCIGSGAVIVGGCCGTSPEHIRRVAASLETKI